MPQRTILYWRDMPAQVIIKDGRKSAKRQLPERFEQAIDMAAMRSGKAGTDDYLNEWRRGEPEDVDGGDLEAIADAESKRIEERYPQERLIAIANNGGLAKTD